jgi:hypothetical protein
MIAVSAGFAFMVTVGFLGLASIIFGRRGVETLQSIGTRSRDATYYGTVAALTAPGLIAFLWLLYRLSDLGYR